MIGAIGSAYLGYLINGAWEQGMVADAFIEQLTKVLSAPFKDYRNETTVQAVGIAIGIYTIAILMHVTQLWLVKKTMSRGK